MSSRFHIVLYIFHVFVKKKPIDDCLTFCTVYLGDVIYRHGTAQQSKSLHKRFELYKELTL